MRKFNCFFVLFLLLGLVGCSIHPIPDDVTRDATVDIVFKIRCEAKDALRQRLSWLFLESNDLRTQRLGLRLKDIYFDIGTLKPDDVDRETFDKVDRFIGSTIAYAFRFTITENNNDNASATFNMPLTNGSFGLALGAGAEKQRKNERVFTISENFADISELRCNPSQRNNENWLYPINGKIGLKEVIDSYIDIAKKGGLNKTFSDTLTFQTLIKANASPKITLTPMLTNHFRLAEANLDLVANRTDVHEVAITIALPVITPPTDKLKIALKDPRAKLVITVPREKRAFRQSTSRRRSKSLFSVSPEAAEASKRNALRESEKQDSIRVLRDIRDEIDR